MNFTRRHADLKLRELSKLIKGETQVCDVWPFFELHRSHFSFLESEVSSLIIIISLEVQKCVASKKFFSTVGKGLFKLKRGRKLRVSLFSMHPASFKNLNTYYPNFNHKNYSNGLKLSSSSENNDKQSMQIRIESFFCMFL